MGVSDIQRLKMIQQELPDLIVCDNDPELTGNTLDQWCYAHGVQFKLHQAKGIIEQRRVEYNEIRLIAN